MSATPPHFPAGNPFCDKLGLTFTSAGAGQSECRLLVSPELFNPNGVLHGGALYAMADTGMGGALFSTLDAGELCATIEIKIVYFKPVTVGVLSCTSRILNRGRRIATLESEIYLDNGLVAKALGTFSVASARARQPSHEA